MYITEVSIRRPVVAWVMSLILIVFVYREDRTIGLGLLLLIIPFTSLIVANIFIKKDEKLVQSADRIR